MIYEVRQETRYEYDHAVPHGRHVLRMTPSDGSGQDVMSSDLTVDPAPAERQEDIDFFGNVTTWILIDRPHDAFVVRSHSVVMVARPPLPDPTATRPFEEIAAHAVAVRDLGARSPAHFIYPSRRVDLSPEVTAYARASFPPYRPVLEGALDLMRRIKADFAYEPGATDVATPPEVAFAAKKGVCQDFAHVMIAGLRGLGLPAAYVSGYIRTLPPPGKPRLEGADATHAWVAVWCGEEAGWIGLDPTNACAAGPDHIVLAFGRDYADVAPVDGVIVTFGEQKLEVKVDVVPFGGPAHAVFDRGGERP